MVGSIEIKYVDPKTLIKYKNNAKIHTDEQINNIAKSIQEYGFVQPVVIDKSKNIVIGHGRVSAALKIGLDVIPCIIIDYLDDSKLGALRIIDNKLNESEWDIESLKKELERIDEFPFDIDFDIKQIEALVLDDECKEPQSCKICYNCPKCGFKFEV